MGKIWTEPLDHWTIFWTTHIWTFFFLELFFGPFFLPLFRPFYRRSRGGGDKILVLREGWDAVFQYSGSAEKLEFLRKT